MNIIYFNPDEMRADAAACYGNPCVRTPNLDRLAAEGCRFEQCHVQHPVCTPSRCSFFTGWYPHVRGHRTLWHCLRPDEPHTMAYLAAAGYDMHWFGKNDLLAPEALRNCGVRVHQTSEGQRSLNNLFSSDDPRRMSFLYPPLSGHNHDYYLVQKAVELIRTRKPGDAPFFLYLPLSFPHCPYTVPEPWYSMYAPDKLPPLLPADLPDKPSFHNLIRRYRSIDRYDESTLRKIRAVYLGMVSYVDFLLGLVLNALDETGQTEATSVLFFSDHGDWAGDYGLVEKWPSGLDDCLTRVPLVIRAPGKKSGHVVREPVECFDIMPTTLDLCEVRPRHTHFARSLNPQLAGAAGDPQRAVFAEGGYNRNEPHCFEGKPEDGVCDTPEGVYYPKGLQQQEQPDSVARCAMIRTATHKLIRRCDDLSELYDLTTDPQERRNLYRREDCKSVRQMLEDRLLEWYLRTSDVTPLEADPRGFSE